MPKSSAKVLVAYATIHGSTREVAEAVGSVLRDNGVSVEVIPAAGVRDVSEYAAVVVGAPFENRCLHKDAHK